MKLLNSKSIINCNEQEEIIHNKEINDVFDYFATKKNYQCAVLKKYQDEKHKEIEMDILSCDLHDVYDAITSCDIKNGIDVCIDDEGFYVFVTYGQSYEYKGVLNLIVTALRIMPYDSNRNFINI